MQRDLVRHKRNRLSSKNCIFFCERRVHATAPPDWFNELDFLTKQTIRHNIFDLSDPESIAVRINNNFHIDIDDADDFAEWWIEHKDRVPCVCMCVYLNGGAPEKFHLETFIRDHFNMTSA